MVALRYTSLSGLSKSQRLRHKKHDRRKNIVYEWKDVAFKPLERRMAMTLSFQDDILQALRGGSLDTLRLLQKLVELRSGSGEGISLTRLDRELKALESAGKVHGSSGFPTYYTLGRIDRSQNETR
jgi:hypothetical protein